MKQLFLFLGVSLALFGETLPVDETVLKGRLKNGLSYTIKSHPHPNGYASVRLAVKVGSVYEREEERGIAHFVEHLVFRGSENFADGEVIRQMEALGAEFGPDTNAETGYEHTLYSLDFPLVDENTLQSALWMLSDFAGRALFLEEAIEKERGVVLDELRVRSSPEVRAYQSLFNQIFAGSSFCDRSPGGSPQIVSTCTPQLLRNFYKQHYRPDRMGVIVVGDVEADEVLGQIKEAFASLEAPTEPYIEPKLQIPLSDEPAFMTYIDPDLSMTAMTFLHLYHLDQTRDLRDKLYESMGERALSERLRQRSQDESSPYVTAGINLGASFASTLRGHELTVIPFGGQEMEALEAAIFEFERIKQHGVTQSEWTHLKSVWRETLTQALKQCDVMTHPDIAADLVDNFLHDTPIISDEVFYTACLDQLEWTTLEELNKYIAKQWSLSPWHLYVVGPEQCLVPLELRGLSYSGLIEPFEESTPQQLDLCIPQVGSVETIEEHQTHTLITLSNGVQVMFHPSNHLKEGVSIKAIAEGGIAMLTEELFNNGKILNVLLSRLELGGLDSQSLEKELKEKNMTFSPTTQMGLRSVAGRAPKPHLEAFFQRFYALFMDRNLATNDFAWIVRNLSEAKRILGQNSETAFYHFLSNELYNHHSLFKPVDCNALSYMAGMAAIDLLFTNPTDFTLVVVGDITLGELTPYLEKYVASIPPKESFAGQLLPLELNTLPPALTFALGHEEKCLTVIASEVTFPKSTNPYNSTIVRKVLARRVYEALRLGLGDSYESRVRLERPIYPYSKPAFMLITYSHSLAEKERAIAIVRKVLSGMITNPPTPEEIARAKEVIRTDLIEESDSHYFALDELINEVLFDDALSSLEELDQLDFQEVMDYSELFLTDLNWTAFTWQAEE